MASGSSAQNLWTTPADDGFSFANFSTTHITAFPPEDCGPFLAMVLCKWDNVLGPRLDHVWRGMGDESLQESSVKYVVSHVLNGELLRSVTENVNVIDLKMFVLKDRGIVCFSFIFIGRGKGGPEISSLTLIIPYTAFKSFLPFVELVEERIKIMLAKLRVLQTKECSSAIKIFSSYWPQFLKTITSLQRAGIPAEVPCFTIANKLKLQLNDTAFVVGQEKAFDPLFLKRAITSHLQTFGSSLVIGKSASRVNLMVNTLAMFLSSDERQRSRYAVEGSPYEYDSDLFVQGLLKDDEENFTLPVKGVITSLFPTTLVDVDTGEVKKTYQYHKHCVIRQEFLDLDLALIWEDEEGAPVYPTIGLFHVTEEIAVMVQTFMNDMSQLPAVCGVRDGFISTFLRILNRKALALIKYVEARSSQGTVRLDQVARRQLRHDLQLTTESDFDIVLVCAEKQKPGVYTFLMGDPRQTVAKLQAVLDTL